MRLFMQNKPNSQKLKTNATSVTAKDYKQEPPYPTQKNKPKQTQSQPAGKTPTIENRASRIKYLPYITTHPYTHVPMRHLRKTNPISKTPKPPQPPMSKRVTPISRSAPPQKNKPNSNPIFSRRSLWRSWIHPTQTPGQIEAKPRSPFIGTQNKANLPPSVRRLSSAFSILNSALPPERRATSHERRLIRWTSCQSRRIISPISHCFTEYFA